MLFYSGFVRVDLFGISIIERASISTKELIIYFTQQRSAVRGVGLGWLPVASGCFCLLGNSII